MASRNDHYMCDSGDKSTAYSVHKSGSTNAKATYQTPVFDCLWFSF